MTAGEKAGLYSALLVLPGSLFLFFYDHLSETVGSALMALGGLFLIPGLPVGFLMRNMHDPEPISTSVISFLVWYFVVKAILRRMAENV